MKSRRIAWEKLSFFFCAPLSRGKKKRCISVFFEVVIWSILRLKSICLDICRDRTIRNSKVWDLRLFLKIRVSAVCWQVCIWIWNITCFFYRIRISWRNHFICWVCAIVWRYVRTYCCYCRRRRISLWILCYHRRSGSLDASSCCCWVLKRLVVGVCWSQRVAELWCHQLLILRNRVCRRKWRCCLRYWRYTEATFQFWLV